MGFVLLYGVAGAFVISPTRHLNERSVNRLANPLGYLYQVGRIRSVRGTYHHAIRGIVQRPLGAHPYHRAGERAGETIHDLGIHHRLGSARRPRCAGSGQSPARSAGSTWWS